MTHFCALVVTDSKLDEDGLEELLWPWNYNNENLTYPRFDYFKIGGRFRGVLDPYFDAADPAPVQPSDQVQKKDLAVDALEERAVAVFARLYDDVQAAIGGLQLPEVAVLRRTHGDRGWSDHFHADPAVKAARKAVPGLWNPDMISFLRLPRHEVLRLERRRAILTLGLVVGDQWHQFKNFDFYEDLVDTEVWENFFNQCLAAVDPESWLTVVDCHR